MDDPVGQPAFLFHDERVIRAGHQKNVSHLVGHEFMVDLDT
jgi:hypothetical protein